MFLLARGIFCAPLRINWKSSTVQVNGIINLYSSRQHKLCIKRYFFSNIFRFFILSLSRITAISITELLHLEFPANMRANNGIGIPCSVFPCSFMFYRCAGAAKSGRVPFEKIERKQQPCLRRMRPKVKAQQCTI